MCCNSTTTVLLTVIYGTGTRYVFVKIVVTVLGIIIITRVYSTEGMQRIPGPDMSNIRLI